MEQLKTLLKARESYLLNLKQEKEKALKTAPEGSLRINRRKNKVVYFHRTDPRDFNGSYIRGQDFQLAQRLAQKDYDTRSLRSINQELHAIQKYHSACPETTAESVYETLNKDRQNLITPILEPEDRYIRNWTSLEYQGKSFDESIPELYTSKDERVRSKSEVIIADLLARESIPYRYEYPIYLSGIGRIYPDFTVLNVRRRKEMYWEHLGMMDDPSYVENALKRITAYEQNGIFPGENLILTYETRQNPLNPKVIFLMIQHYLQ